MDILAFFAHPDDETMLCGGTLALLSSLGAHVHLLIATRGEGGENGDPEVCSREQLGQVRENELRCAAQALGAASLTVMDYIDPTVGPDNQLFPFTNNIDPLAAELVEAIRLRKASVLLAHGINGEYGHPAHKLAHQAACLAVQALGEEAPLFYTVQAAFASHPYPRLANADTPAHLVLNISPALSRKTEAALCHRTQHALFIRHHSQEAGRTLSVPEVIMRLESLHRVLPQANGAGQIHDALADLLWSSGSASLPAAG